MKKGRLFEITYLNPDTQKYEVLEKEFFDSESLSAREWADDYAYTLADKGPYKLREKNPND